MDNHRPPQCASTNVAFIDALPDELLVLVFRMLPCVVRTGRCGLVCKRWHRVALDDKSVGVEVCAGQQGTSPSHNWGRHHMWAGAAANRGHLLCLQHACAGSPMYNVTSLAAAAAGNGHVNVLRWIWSGERAGLVGEVAASEVMVAAIKGNRIDAVDFLVSHGVVIPSDACAVAARRGHMDMMCYARDKNCAWDARVCREAALGGHLECLTYAHVSGLSLDTCNWRSVTAMGETHIPIIRYACANGYAPQQSWFDKVVAKSYVAMVRHLVEEQGYLLDECDHLVVAHAGHMEVMQYVESVGCPRHDGACEAAVRSGNTKMLRYLHERGCPWDWSACHFAATRENCRTCLDYLMIHKSCTGRCRIRSRD